MTVCWCRDAIMHTQIFEQREAYKAKLAKLQNYRDCSIAENSDDYLRENEVENFELEEEELDSLIWDYGSYLFHNCPEYKRFLLVVRH